MVVLPRRVAKVLLQSTLEQQSELKLFNDRGEHCRRQKQRRKGAHAVLLGEQVSHAVFVFDELRHGDVDQQHRCQDPDRRHQASPQVR